MVRRSLPSFLGLAALGAALASCDYVIGRSGNGTSADDSATDGGFADGGSADGAIPDDGGATDDADGGFTKACNTEVHTLTESPLDLLVLLDVSTSMDYDQKWTSVKLAMQSFVHNPQFNGLGLGLQYFPLRVQCSIDAYRTPAVPIGVLPNVADAVSSSLDAQEMYGGTPTVQALEGTSAYVKSFLSQHVGHKAAIVVATDGIPDNTCLWSASGPPNNLSNVLTVAKNAAQSNPMVETFVIGVGKDLTALNQIAAAGGTGRAILVDTGTKADEEFLNALMQVRRSALGCDFVIPLTGSKGEIDPTRARVRFMPADGSPPATFVNVGTKASCASAPGRGWFFDDADNSGKLMLCDDACSAVTGGTLGDLQVDFACGFVPK